MADSPSSTALDERYEILAEISKGGMGVVYKAHDRTLGKLVAVKILRPGQNVPGARRRFLNEAQLLSRLVHPNIVVVHDFGTLNDGRNFLTMEYLSGPTLGGLLKTQQGRMEPLRACRIVQQIARALQSVHDQGIVHRDLKPENIFLVEQDGQRDFVKLIDFGIAKDTINKDDGKEEGASSSSGTGQLSGLADESYSSETAKTKPGTALGSPRYMAPEQVRGGDIDGRTDQYALGCILYYLLVGAVPFDGTSPLDVMMAHVTRPVPPPRQRVPELLISDTLEALVLRMLAKDRAQRFPSLRELDGALATEIAALEKQEKKAPRGKPPAAAAQSGTPEKPSSRGVMIAVFAIVLVSLIGGAAYLLRMRFLLRGDGGSGSETPAEVSARQAESRTLAEASLRWARGALSDRSPAVREVGVAVLGDCPMKEALPLLSSMLDDADPTVRIATARALSRRPTAEPQAQSALRLALRDNDARVLVAARSGLLALGDREQRAQLRILVAHTDIEVRRLLAEGSAADSDLLDILDKLLGDESILVRYAAARSIAILKPGEPRAIALINTITDPKQKLLSAPRLPVATALPIIEQAAADSDPPLRRLAAEAIVELPAQGPAGPLPRVEMLRRLGNDADPVVAARAKAVLARFLSKPANRR